MELQWPASGFGSLAGRTSNGQLETTTRVGLRCRPGMRSINPLLRKLLRNSSPRGWVNEPVRGWARSYGNRSSGGCVSRLRRRMLTSSYSKKGRRDPPRDPC